MIEIIILSLALVAVIYLLWRSEEKYYILLQKQFEKSTSILEKHDKEFLKTFAQVFKKEKPIIVKETKSENTIEKESEAEEINLVDMPRIPIVDGVKIKFEDENETQTININPMEEYNTQNPIEK